MILTALKELAEQEELLQNPDYQPAGVRWLITLNADGAPLGGMRDTLTKPSTGKGKAVPGTFDVPKRSKRTTQDLPEFMVDKAEYVLGWAESPAQEKRGRRRHQLYVEEVERAFAGTNDEALGALVKFLQGFNSGQVTLARPEELAAGDLIGFQYFPDPDVSRLLSDRPAVAAYWSARRRELEGGAAAARAVGEVAKCLVTGKACIPVRLHPKIKGIPPVSDTKGGVQLTSINAPAFASYGLEDVGCATVSPEAADAYEKALNRLLAVAYPDPKVMGGILPLRHFRLSDNTVVAYWSKGGSEEQNLFAAALSGGEPEAVEALFKAPWKGRRVNLRDPAPFYALTLSGGQGRGTVRGWLETTLGVALSNVKTYFEDLEIVRPAADAGKPRPLLGLLRQVAVQGKLDNIAPGHAGDLFAAVLSGHPFPYALLAAAIRRTRAERTLYHDRAALIKAYLLRARRAGRLPPSFPEVRDMLDENCANPAYRLGRLFAVLEKVQEDATGAKSTIRDRYYGAASATPVVVFPQLLRKAPHHLPKLGKAATRFEKLLQSICDGLQPPTPFPTTLTLEEQGLFAVGYYHQRQSLFTKRAEKGSTESHDQETANV
jgi:CRISPR-associated protein Csd1